MSDEERPVIVGSLREGDVLQQKYRLEKVIGQGGMAIVASAFHLTLEQRVAIKLIRPEVASHPQVVARFLREARALSRIKGEHVARVLDVDALPGGAPFIVMEHLEGIDLARLLREKGPVVAGDAARFIREAALAIAEAHALGIIHRDIKPANLFLTKRRTGEPFIKVLDFGISKLLAEGRITQTAVAMGSAEYMSPEQMQSTSHVDGRTDLWALGVTLYELCTGFSPFHAEGVGQVCIKVMTASPKPPRQVRSDLSPAIEAVILKCLEKDLKKRYATAEELAAALAPLATAPRPPASSAPKPEEPPPVADPRSGVQALLALTPASAAPRPPSASQPVIGPASSPGSVPAALAPTTLPGDLEPASGPPRALMQTVVMGDPAAARAAAWPPSRGAVEAAPTLPSGASQGRGPAASSPGVPVAAATAKAPASKVPLVAAAVLGVLIAGVVIASFLIGRGGDASAARFRLGPDTLVDSASKLTWQRKPGPGAMSYEAARTYCERAGEGYRLPDIEELKKLLDVTKVDPPLDPASFPTSPVDTFWSGSLAPDGSGARWVVHFSTGRVAGSALGLPNRVRCVR